MSTTPALNRTLLHKIESARARTDELFELLKPEALYSRPIPERHRLIFYLGHLEAFDWNQICRQTLGIPSFHPEFDQLFEFGIDPPVGQTPQDQPSDWPSEQEVRAYNRRTRAIVDEVLEQTPEQIIHVALEHRLMHAETLAYLLHNLPYDQKIPVYPHPIQSIAQPPTRMIQIPSGQATLGQKAGEFGWDNEFDQHQVYVPGFAIRKH
jgi:iron(II)-dependent oxidoreductase